MSEHRQTISQLVRGWDAHVVALCCWVALCVVSVAYAGYSASIANSTSAQVSRVQQPAPKQSSLPPMPAATAVRAASVATVKTNGVVTLAWTPGEPEVSTVISNLTLGTSYAVGAATNITLGQQLVGTNVYRAMTTSSNLSEGPVATNRVFASPLATVVSGPDTNFLSLYGQMWIWKGKAGVLQASADAKVWRDVRAIPTGGVIFSTNNLPQEFYRVKL